MDKQCPITRFQISERKRNMDKKDNVSKTNYNIRNMKVSNESALSNFISKVSKNPLDCDSYWKPIVEMISELDKNTDKSHRVLYGLLENQIIPKLSKDELKSMNSYISENDIFDNENIQNSINDTLVTERIVTNHNALSKRFNIDKIARECVVSGNIHDGILEMCELIDTYDMSTNAKFNIAMENISYVLRNNGYNESIIEDITDYFLMRESIITDDTYDTMSKLITESRILTEADKKKVSHITKKKGSFKDSVGILSVKCKNKECKDHILAVVNVKSEKQASDYIKKSAKLSLEYPDDAVYVKASIMTIPLIGKVSKQFVSYRYKIAIEDLKINAKYIGIESDKAIDDALEDDETDLLEYAEIVECNISQNFVSEYVSVKGMVNPNHSDTSVAIAVGNPVAAVGALAGCHLADITYRFKLNSWYKKNGYDKCPDFYDFIRKHGKYPALEAYIKSENISLLELNKLSSEIIDLKSHINMMKHAKFNRKNITNEDIDLTIKELDRLGGIFEKRIKEVLQKRKNKSHKESVNDIISNIDTDSIELLESEDFAESQDIKDVLNDFKAEQKKDIGRLKYYLGKIYRKSPESIIDSTPNILGVIRATFIIAPAATVPIIGPITSLLLVFIDKLLSMKVNDKQTEKLLKKLDAEKEKVEKDIEKKPEKKEELEKYKKCLEQCIKKVEGYREANISDKPIEGRKGSDDDFDFGDSGSDDDLFGADPDFDIDFESAIVYMDQMANVLEMKNNGIEQKLYDNLRIMIESDLSGLLDIVYNCPISINLENLIEEINSIKKEFDFDTRIDIGSTVLKYYKTPVKEVTHINDVLMESFCLNQLNEILDYAQQVQEGVDVSTKIKLAMNTVKDKFKLLNAKQKEIWKNIDIYASGFRRSVEKALTSDRREAVIRGSMIPSFSKCIKAAIVGGAAFAINPVIAIIGAFAAFGASKRLNYKERQLIFDEIDTELKVVEKQIEMANNEGDMKQYRFLLQYQKKLEREKQRIQYKIKVYGRDMPVRPSSVKDD